MRSLTRTQVKKQYIHIIISIIDDSVKLMIRFVEVICFMLIYIISIMI